MLLSNVDEGTESAYLAQEKNIKRLISYYLSISRSVNYRGLV